MAKETGRKKLAEMSYEEILRLPKEEFSALMNADAERYYHGLTDVGPADYARYTMRQKVSFWASSLNRQMRWQVESGLDEYAIFSPDWYRATKKVEPLLDEIMDQVFADKGFSEWNKQEYLRRIRR